MYWHLINEEVSSGNRTEARIHLEQYGVAVDSPERNFVTD